jgi:PAS domain S-box-containing protein
MAEDIKQIPSQSFEWYRDAFLNSRDAIMAIEPPSWRFTAANPATLKLFAAKDYAEFISKGPWEVSSEFQPDGRPSNEKALEMINIAMEKGSNFFEWTHKRITGEEFPSSVLLTRFKSGGMEMVQATVRDISDLKKSEVMLRDNNYKTQLVLNSVAESIVGIDLDGKCTFYNNSTLRMIGCKDPRELLGKNVHTLIHSKHLDGTFFPKEDCLIFQDALKGKYAHTEEVFWRFDGVSFPVEVWAYPLCVGSTVTGAVITFFDITERKKTQKEMLESKIIFETLFNSAAEGIIVADMDMKKFSNVNPAICMMFGYSEEDFKQLWVTDIHPKEVLDYVQAEFEAQVRGAKTLASDLLCVRKNGSKFYANVSAAFAIINGHRCNVGFFTDVTEQRKTALSLIESETKYRYIVEHIPDVTWSSDINGNTIYISPNFENVSGFTPDEMMKNAEIWFGRIHPDDMARVKAAYEAIFIKGERYDVEYRYQKKRGEWIWVHDKAVTTYEKDGVKYCDGIFADITVKKTMEDELNKAYIMAAAANDAKSDFLGNIRHELVTPLTSILGFTEVLEDEAFGKLNNKQKEYLSYIKESSKSLYSLVSNILDFVKIEEGEAVVDEESFLLNDLFCSVKDMLNEKIVKHNNRLVFEFGPSLDFEMKGDIKKIKQILFKLISNAIKFSPDGGSIIVRAMGKGGNFIEISVQDKGIGIKHEDLPKMFGIFVLLEHPILKRFSGVGLGLAYIKRLVELCGGEIWVESEGLGRGSTFKFTIPINTNNYVT